MKNILLFVLLTIFSLPNLVAQEVKLKTKDTNEVYEEYYVLASDKKVKHGSYLKITKPLMGVWGNNYFSLIGNYEMGEKHGAWEQYYPNCNQIEFKGYYKNCLKDSIWIYYYPDIDEKEIREIRTETGTRIEILNINDRVSAKGKYRKNEKVGIWEYYNLEQDLIQKYDYDHNTLLFHNEYDDLQNKPLTYIGGEYEMNRSLYKLFDLEKILGRIHNKLGLDPGEIIISFEVDKDGGIRNKQVIKNELGNKKLLNHSLNFVDQLNNCWSPEYIDGNSQSSKAKIHFILDVEKSHESYIYDRWSVDSMLLKFNFKIKLENMFL